MQLSLFDWERVETGVGLISLAELDFNDARKRFELVLKSHPGHAEAGRGMRDLNSWQETLAEYEKLKPEANVRFLWEKIGSFSFDKAEYSDKLRRNLIRLLLDGFDGIETYYHPPDLCCGYLNLQLGNFASAETGLRTLSDHLPDNGLLHLYLGEALYLQGKKEVSGPAYTRALLLMPNETMARVISHKALTNIIKEYGPSLAPIYGFFQGLLPLVEHNSLPDTKVTRIYQALRRAEQSRRKGDHYEMIAARKVLKDLSREIFQDYLETLE